MLHCRKNTKIPLEMLLTNELLRISVAKGCCESIITFSYILVAILETPICNVTN